MKSSHHQSFLLARWDWGILIVGSLLVVLTRWVYRSTYLFHWDSVQFALALDNLDVIKHQPHPPGYIVYVWLGKAIHSLIPDPNLALIILGILASVVGLILIFLLARIAFNRKVAYLATGFFIVNPLVWFHGLVAEAYIVEAVFVLAFVLAAYRYAMSKTLSALIITAVILGLMGGVRQSAEIVMLPLLIYVLYITKASWQRWFIGLGVLVFTNLIWFIPLLISSGGIARYLAALWRLTYATVSVEYARYRWDALITNLSLAVQALQQAFWPGLLMMIGAGLPFIAPESRNRYRIDPSRFWFWVIAVAPVLLFIPVILMKNTGYMLSVATLLLILGAAAIVFIADVVGNWQTKLLTPTLVVLGGLVLVMQGYNFFALRPGDFYYFSASRNSVLEIDQHMRDMVSTINKNFEPESSALWITGDYVFFGGRHFQYYFPEFDTYVFTPKSFIETNDQPIWHLKGPAVSEFIPTMPLSANIRYLVAIRRDWHAAATDYQKLVTTSSGDTIAYYDLDDPETAKFFSQDNRFNITR